MVQRVIDWMCRLHGVVYGERVVTSLERIIAILATAAFLLHLSIIAWVKASSSGVDLDWFSSSYLAALYTPFSFLLFFEVFALVRVLPESFSRSVALQFEIVALIVLRRVFKDIAHLDGVEVIELTNPVVWEAAADMVGSLLLFSLVRGFSDPQRPHAEARGPRLERFVALKQALSVVLGAVVLLLAASSLTEWGVEMVELARGQRDHLADVNAVFYEDFFGLMVLVDVLLLLSSYSISRDVIQVFRNAGFIASTVLVRLSFMAPRLSSLVLLAFAVAFALAVHKLSRRFERTAPTSTEPQDSA